MLIGEANIRGLLLDLRKSVTQTETLILYKSFRIDILLNVKIFLFSVYF